jgi:hypothetical protein
MEHKYVEMPMNSDTFDYKGVRYDCSSAISKDKALILQEAESSHKSTFDEEYLRDSLRPSKIRLFVDDNDLPRFAMVIYIIDYKDHSCGRYACGNYYPFYEEHLMPHFYQASICW